MEETFYDNPYLNSNIVQDPQMLVGRSELLKRIYAVIATGGSISLVGPPRIGKGSLLYCLRFKELQQFYGGTYTNKLCSCIYIFVDMRVDGQRSWDSFFKRLNKAIVAQSQDSINLEGISIDGSEGFTALVDEITDKGFRLVLALDSFEKLKENERLSSLLPMFLRSEAARVSYVVASTLPLNKIFPREPLSSPFYNIFPYPEVIGALAPVDARELVVRPLKDARTFFCDDEVDWIVKQAGSHPFFSQCVCQMMFDMKASAQTSPVNLQQAEETAYQRLYQHFTGLWYGMEERQQQYLSTELFKKETRVFYDSALFRRFVEAQSKGEATIQIEDVRDALKKLGDPAILGQSRLRHLKVVAAHLNGNTQPSHSDIGVALRTVLFDAWKRLEGQSTRRDTDPEWESYNILNYRYFKHHMQNEHLAARLAMSPRTYFRNRNIALQKLSFALQEMEDEIE